MGCLLRLFEEEWHNGNIELILDGGDLRQRLLESLHRQIFLERPASGERWVKCYIVLKGRHENLISNEDLRMR